MKKPTTTDLPGYLGDGSGPGGGDIPAARTCTQLDNGRRTCLHQLAAGYQTTAGLCGPCTSRFMNALDWVSGEDLPWHDGYINRIESQS